MHRSSVHAPRTLFHPGGGSGGRGLACDTLSRMQVEVPRWLQGRESVGAWCQIWELSILGLMVWIDGRARVRLLPHRAGDLTTVCGAGSFTLALSEVTMAST